ncbi:MAG: lipoyl(octanoyl) transferase LipB [Candidatus Marinimicrobia bacterium]|nr:lipoyl(octanoyl) transferase LipB [Candidatus Neomarinimicrobiota bacterium]
MSNNHLTIKALGTVPYMLAWDIQKEHHAARLAGEISDTLLLLEHPPAYTFGKNANTKNLLNPRDAEVIQSDRGGDITFHGPGQIVGYPILNLKEHQTSVSWYMRTLEAMIIRTLGNFSIEADRIAGLTGVWVGDRKICAMGVRLSKWVTMHGFALNVAPDLSYFAGMIPCGISDKGITSMQMELGQPITITEVSTVLVGTFQRTFGFEHVEYTRLVEPFAPASTNTTSASNDTAPE